MKCPACGNELTRMVAGEITIDVCKGGCAGIWFDKWELDRVDEKHEAAGEMLLDVERGGSIAVDPGKKRNCPNCGNIVMMRHFFTAKQQIEIDECPRCGGFWLDAGELRAIREQFETAAGREKAAQELIASMFGGELAEMEEEREKKSERTAKIKRMLRFLCPSYYIPGDQDWGAF